MKKLLILLFMPFIGLGQQTYIPDDDFEQHLINEGYDNVLDDFVITSAIDTVSALYLGFFISTISDLTGLEDFTLLKTLSISPSLNLTTLDVSQNTLLEDLSCRANQLTDIDVSNNTALTYLNCSENQITNLDVSNNTALTYLNCKYNYLTIIDVSNNSSLTDLDCSNNQLIALDIRNGNNANIASIRTENNLNLTCISVDDSQFSLLNWVNAFWFGFDQHHYFSNNCVGTSIGEKIINKKSSRITDILGRETKVKKNKILVYIYDDGTVDKKIVVE